jgi:hypothetical protein
LVIGNVLAVLILENAYGSVLVVVASRIAATLVEQFIVFVGVEVVNSLNGEFLLEYKNTKIQKYQLLVSNEKLK